MTNDAKLGLLAGVAGVLMVAVVYFPKAGEAVAGTGGQAAITGPALAGTAIAPPAMTPTAVEAPAMTVSRTVRR